MLTLERAIVEFTDFCKYDKNLNYKSIKAYSIDLKQFYSFTLSINNIAASVSDIDKQLLREYLKMLSVKYKVKTIKRKVATLKSFFTFLVLEEYILVTPFNKLTIRLREPFILPKILTLNEVKIIFQSAYEAANSCTTRSGYRYHSRIRDIAVLELLFATGIRVSELCNLQKSDVDISAKYITINGKNNKQRLIYLSNDSMITILLKYLQLFEEKSLEHNNFFVNRNYDPLSEQSVRNIVKNHATRINKKVTPHVFRHTFATLLLEEGVDIFYIQKLLGHHSIVVTQIYTHASKAKQKEVLVKNHPRKNIVGLDLNEG